jgi:hypothetical protein
LKTIPLPEEVTELYALTERLTKRYPGRPFTPDGHLVGSLGEVITAEKFGWTLLPCSNPGHDARDADGRDVQIKLVGPTAKRVSLYATCDRLLVLRIVNPQEAEIVFDGLGAGVWDACGPMQKNGQRSVAISKLRLMQSAED